MLIHEINVLIIYGDISHIAFVEMECTVQKLD